MFIASAHHAPIVIEHVAHSTLITMRKERSNGELDAFRQEPWLKQQFIRSQTMGLFSNDLRFSRTAATVGHFI